MSCVNEMTIDVEAAVEVGVAIVMDGMIALIAVVIGIAISKNLELLLLLLLINTPPLATPL